LEPGRQVRGAQRARIRLWAHLHSCIPAGLRKELTEINSNAPVVSRHEIAINAPLESVWRVFTEIDRWPEWNPDIPKATVAGLIAVGTVIHWETAGMAIPSTIGEVVPLKKIAWSGETSGILGLHVWTFSAAAEGTQVRTEESWEGASVPAQTKDLQDALDASLVRWLSFLRRRAEAVGP
jgi:uncharacterized protein YndB with AHSA1/START domain